MVEQRRENGQGEGGYPKVEAETKKVTSIARKINFNTAMFLLGRYLVMDIVLVMILIVVVTYCLDVQNLGYYELALDRRLYMPGGLETLVYQVGDAGDSIFFRVALGAYAKPVLYAGIVLGVFEVIEVVDRIVSGTGKVRKELRPIQEIAIQAQQQMSELAQNASGMMMDENSYHDLEHAITSLKVEKPNARISMNNRELQGIERAVNDLLDRMRASYRQQTQFVSDASHELRTPIAVIQGYVNMLDRWGKEDEAILDEAIEAIKNESTHMQKLVEQLLFLARGDSNRQKLEKKRVLLNDIMREVYEESLMIDEKHHYSFEENGTAEIYADADMIKQSARILIDNAAKYTQAGEDIVIRTGLWNDGAPFYSIQDNGIGMSQDDVSHAFDRFYRADAVRNSKTGGTGLGLAIARWIVEQHDGYYNVVSREEIGTRFNVIFPKCIGDETYAE